MSEQPAPRRGLGRGLELLIGPVAPTEELVQLPVGAIRAMSWASWPAPEGMRLWLSPSSCAAAEICLRITGSVSAGCEHTVGERQAVLVGEADA